MLDSATEGVLQGLVNDNYCNQILVRVDIVVMPGVRRNLFSVMKAAKKGNAAIFDYENPGLEGSVLQGLVNDNYCNQILVRVDIVVMPGVRRNLFSVMKAAKKGNAAIFDYENPGLEGSNVTVPLRSENGDLYSFVLDLSADQNGAKGLEINAVANA